MDCLECKKKIIPYLDYELDDEELNDFVNHIESCKSCREDLEVYYLVTEGVGLLDNKDRDYNLSKAFKNRLSDTDKYLRRLSLRRILAYAADTVSFWALFVISIMCLRMLVL